MFFDQMCLLVDLPKNRERLARRAIRNIMSRAFISKREATLIIGVFRELLQRNSLKNE